MDFIGRKEIEQRPRLMMELRGGGVLLVENEKYVQRSTYYRQIRLHVEKIGLRRQ